MTIATLVSRLRRHVATAVAARQFELVSDLRRAIALLERFERERAFTPLARRAPSAAR
jgi:hypothetical protein